MNSEIARNAGNYHFGIAKNSQNLQEKKINFGKAIIEYQKAIDLAKIPEERLMALKNKGVTFFNILMVEKDVKLKMHFLFESSEVFAEIQNSNTDSQSADWVKDINDKLDTNLDIFYRLVIDNFEEKKDRNKYYEQLDKFCKFAKWEVKATILESWLENLEKQIIEDLQGGRPKNVINHVKESYTPMMHYEALKNKKETDYQYWVQYFEKSTHLAEGLRSLIQAEDMRLALLDMKNADTDDVLEVVDCFNSAITFLDVGGDVESQAVCYAKTGVLYYRKLGDQLAAKEYFRQAINQAQSLSPKDVSDTNWYKMAVKILKEINDKEEEIRRAKVEGALKKFKDKLKKLEEYFPPRKPSEISGSFEYLAKEFPPKNSIKIPNSPDYKKKVQRWIMVYHPDKNVDVNQETKFVFEEVTKILNGHLCTRG